MYTFILGYSLAFAQTACCLGYVVEERRGEPEVWGVDWNRSVSSAPANSSLGSRGGGVCCDSLHSSVGQDALRELLLGFGEAGSCSPVLGVNLRGRTTKTQSESLFKVKLARWVLLLFFLHCAKNYWGNNATWLTICCSCVLILMYHYKTSGNVNHTVSFSR